MTEPPAASALLIAIVDDDDVDRMAAERALRKSMPDASIVAGGSVQEARDLVANATPDVLFLDLRLPDGDGYDLVAELRRDGSDLPIIVLTGHGDEQTAVAVMKRGASDYIPKSALSPERVEQSVRHVLRVRDAERRERHARGELEAYARKLNALVEVSARAHLARTVDGVARVVAEAARSIIGSHVAVVRVVAQESTDEVRAVALSERDRVLAPALPGDRSRDWESIDRVMRFDSAALAADPAASARALAAGLNLPVRGWLAAPIVSRDSRSIGVIHLSDKVEREFTESDALLLVLLAQAGSAALENAALFEAMTKASQARDDMLAVVSHDLRNPLNTITMAVALLRGAQSADRSVHESHLERISRSSSLMLRLVSDLLDVTRIEAGSLTVEKRELSASAVVDEAVDSIRAVAAKSGVTIETVIPDDSPTFLGDRDRILQALGNLLGNAVKFTPKGGLVKAAVMATRDSLVFTVEDTGPGIPLRDQARVFERYFQGRARAALGAGLGLFITKGIVAAHGGDIRLESHLGAGSKFFITLPLEADRASSVA